MKIKIGSHSLTISNPDKTLFPKAKLTKADLVVYYQMIAPIMVLYLKNRPLSLNRFPNGVGKETFYQKDAQDFYPDYIALQPIKRSSGATITYAMINNAASLVYMANLVGEPHIWLSHGPKLNYPDRMIFDFDPSPGVPFATIKWAAKQMKQLLEKLGLHPFVMTTGSRGLHVVVPLKQTMLFDEVREFAQQIAAYLAQQYPSKLTIELSKAKRGKKIFIDYLRNAWSATSIAPYGVRALDGAPVATPIKWSELAALRSAQKYTIQNIKQRIARVGDAWKGIEKKASGLTMAMKELKKMITRKELT